MGKQLVPPTVLTALQAMTPLQRGRSAAKDRAPVKPVPQQFVNAVLPHVNRFVAAMIELQLHSGMRPGEVVLMRGVDIDLGGKVWLYKPEVHKLSYRGTERSIALGPKCQDIIRPFLVPDVSAYLFSPARDREERFAAKRAARQSPVQPSQTNRKKRQPAKVPGQRYTTASYEQAIRKACHAADVPTWGPGRLRHNFATAVRKQHGIESVQALLGHARLNTSEIYAEKNAELATRIAGTMG